MATIINLRVPDTGNQSGKTDVTGGITRAGDEMVRTALMKPSMFYYRV